MLDNRAQSSRRRREHGDSFDRCGTGAGAELQRAGGRAGVGVGRRRVLLVAKSSSGSGSAGEQRAAVHHRQRRTARALAALGVLDQVLQLTDLVRLFASKPLEPIRHVEFHRPGGRAVDRSRSFGP